ncbi:hypothetical protein FACS1894166_04620 [Bacilli bacterium]|nr:hypothetical protein FACS1894166_04620 [Bacilli bacterium]
MQDRGIKTLEEANNVVNSILDELNQYLKQKVEKTLSVYSPLDISEDIYAILCYRDIRTGDNGDCIHVDNEYYQAYEGQRVIPIKGKQVLFMKTLDGRTFINAWNKTYIAVMGLRYWDRNLGRYVYPNGLENAGK